MEKVKKCKYCCQEIDAKAKICPHCGKKQSKKKLLIIAAIAAVIVIIGAAGSSGNKNKVGDIDSSGQSSASSNETIYAGLGQFVEGEDWKISLLDAKTYTSIGDSSGFYTEEPDSGKIYLVMFLEAENISDKDNYFNPLYVEAYADGYSVSTELLINNPDNAEAITGDVAAGKKIKGYIAWQVDKNWSEFEMTYNSGIWTDEKAASFKITSEDLN